MNAVAPLPPSLSRLHAAFSQHGGATMPVRQQAFNQFLQRGFPTTRDEHWKYTQLRRLEAREFAVGRPDAAYNLTSPATDTYQLVFVDGFYRASLSTLPDNPDVVIRSLAALTDDPATLARALGITANDTSRFAGLNTALTQDGVLIEVAANTALDKPVVLKFVWSNAEHSLMAHPRIVIQMGTHSKLCVVEQYQGEDSQTAHFTNAVTTLQLASGAQLEHCRVQNENSSSFHIGLIHAELAAQSSLISHQINFGAALARIDINALLQGNEASITLNGLQFASGAQHQDTHTRVEHCVPHTRSNEDYRGIADQRSRVVFNGKVVVAEKAIKTDAQQSSRNLLLANTAEIDTKPELEIYNDDVKCAHGATVGQLDANALFYLRSRGLSEAQARALLTHAFADHIIAQLPVAALREQLTTAGHARFGATLEVGV